MRIFCLLITLSILSNNLLIAQSVLTNEDIVRMNQSKVSSRIIMDKIQVSHTSFDLSTHSLKTLVAANLSDPILETMLQVTKQLDVLTNEDVIALHETKLSNRLLKQKILASRSQYDVSTEGLIQLKNARVPDSIVKLMMTSPAGASPKKPLPTPATYSGSKTSARRPDYCKTWFDKFTKTTITASRVTLRGRKASNIILGSSVSTLAGIEDLEVSMLFRRDGESLSLGIYASKPGLHELYVDKNKPFMLLLHDNTVMSFNPIQESESDIAFHLFSAEVDSKLLIYYSLTHKQLRILAQKTIKEYRLNTFNRHFEEDTVNQGRAEQVQAAAKCLLDS